MSDMGIEFDTRTQRKMRFGKGTERQARGVRISPNHWDDLSIYPPDEHISKFPADLADLSVGVVLCIRKPNRNSLLKYAYLVDVDNDKIACKLIPCHGSAKTIYIPHPKTYELKGEINKFKREVREEHDNTEAFTHTEIDLYYVSDEWLIHEVDDMGKIVSQAI